MALDFPTSPTNGQVYGAYVYDSSITAWRSKGVAQAATYVSDTAPSGATKGDMWYRSSDGTTYVYYVDADTSQWVEIRSEIATSKVGLVPIVPTNVTVNSGTATVSASGLVSFSGSTNISLNGVFSAAYKNYRIIANYAGGSADNVSITFVFRNAGTDKTTGYYYSGIKTNAIDATSGIWSGNNAGNMWLGQDRALATTQGLSSIDVGTPFISGQSTLTFQTVSYSGSAFYNIAASGVYSIADINDSFSLVYGGGTHTGSLQAYGYN